MNRAHNGEAEGGVEVVLRHETSDLGDVAGDGDSVEQRLVIHHEHRNFAGENSWRRREMKRMERKERQKKGDIIEMVK